MVFFFIACHSQGAQEPEIASMVNSTLQGSKPLGECYTVSVEKMKFKVGTLDSLIELNESLNKVDASLDATVKKIEKMAKELMSGDLMIEVSQSQKSKMTLSYSHLVHVIDYIKNFKWEDNKYPRARSLVELSGMIMEVALKGLTLVEDANH